MRTVSRLAGFFTIPILALTGFGCKTVNNQGAQSTEPVTTNQTQSPTQETNIYRYLSAISDQYPDRDSLTELCIRQHDFRLELPRKRILSARDIRLPASEKWTEIEKVERIRYKTVTIQPASVNGIIMAPKTENVPYSVTENVETMKSVSGVCIGAEYILQ